MTPARVVLTDRAGDVLRLLARDLLTCMAAPRAGTDDADAASEAPPSNVRPIDAPPGVVPALELSSDGTWKPSTAQVGGAKELEAGHRPAYVSTLVSRYPDVAAKTAAYTVLPAPAAADASPAPTPRGPEPPAPEPATPTTAAPPMAERAAPTRAETVIQAVSGGVELVAGPFDRFQMLAAFVKALRGLPGVQDVTTRQFVRGMVHLRVRYSDPISLTTRIAGMTEFAPEIVSSAHTRIEIRVRTPDDLPPARG